MMHKVKLMAVIAVAMIVCGCAATQKLSDADRAKLNATKVSDTVQKGPMFLLAPSAANIGMMFGAVGGAVTGAAAVAPSENFANFLDKNAISIEKIVREEFEQTLRASGKLAIANQGDSVAPTVNISVLQYGFGVTHLLSSNVVPVMQLKCDMVDSSGRLLWSANERMLPSIASPMEPMIWSQLRDDPKQIEEQWRKAARHLFKSIVAEL